MQPWHHIWFYYLKVSKYWCENWGTPASTHHLNYEPWILKQKCSLIQDPANTAFVPSPVTWPWNNLLLTLIWACPLLLSAPLCSIYIALVAGWGELLSAGPGTTHRCNFPWNKINVLQHRAVATSSTTTTLHTAAVSLVSTTFAMQLKLRIIASIYTLDWVEIVAYRTEKNIYFQNDAAANLSKKKRT